MHEHSGSRFGALRSEDLIDPRETLVEQGENRIARCVSDVELLVENVRRVDRDLATSVGRHENSRDSMGNELLERRLTRFLATKP